MLVRLIRVTDLLQNSLQSFSPLRQLGLASTGSTLGLGRVLKSLGT